MREPNPFSAGNAKQAYETGIAQSIDLYFNINATGTYRTPLDRPTAEAVNTYITGSAVSWDANSDKVNLIAVLGEGPGWAAGRMARHDEAAWRRSPGPGRWSGLEVLCHLRDADREVFGPRLEMLLAGGRPVLPDVSTRGWDEAREYRAQSPARALEEWTAARSALVARLSPLSRADWERTGLHPSRG